MPISKRRDYNNNPDDQEEESLAFLQKRVTELVAKLETIEEDVERMAFVMALFGKYMQYYSAKNNHMVNKDVVRMAIVSTDQELRQGFEDQNGITEFDEEMIISYLERIQERMYELSDEERKKMR